MKINIFFKINIADRDLVYLRGLQSLQYLVLSDNRDITNVVDLAFLLNLKELDLSYTKVSDLTPPCKFDKSTRVDHI